jgi:hypothetical protein
MHGYSSWLISGYNFPYQESIRQVSAIIYVNTFDNLSQNMIGLSLASTLLHLEAGFVWFEDYALLYFQEFLSLGFL